MAGRLEGRNGAEQGGAEGVMTRKSGGELVVGDLIAAIWIKPHGGGSIREWLDCRAAPLRVAQILEIPSLIAGLSPAAWTVALRSGDGAVANSVVVDERCLIDVIDDSELPEAR